MGLVLGSILGLVVGLVLGLILGLILGLVLCLIFGVGFGFDFGFGVGFGFGFDFGATWLQNSADTHSALVVLPYDYVCSRGCKIVKNVKGLKSAILGAAPEARETLPRMRFRIGHRG